MSAANIRALPGAAHAAPSRTITVELTEGEYAGWRAVCLATFPARLLADLDSGKIGLILAALDKIIVEHNMPGPDGKVAKHVGDVDFSGLLAIVQALGSQLGAVPNPLGSP